MQVDAVRIYVYIVWKQGFTLAARVTRNKSSRIIRIRELRFRTFLLSTNLSRKVTKLFPRLYKLLKNVLPSPSRYSVILLPETSYKRNSPRPIFDIHFEIALISHSAVFIPPPPPQDNNKFEQRLEDKVSKMEMGGRVILITVGKGGRRGTKWHGRF